MSSYWQSPTSGGYLQLFADFFINELIDHFLCTFNQVLRAVKSQCQYGKGLNSWNVPEQ